MALRPDDSLPGWPERLPWLFHGFVESGNQAIDLNMTLSSLTPTDNKGANIELLQELEARLVKRFLRQELDTEATQLMRSRCQKLSMYWPSALLVDIVSRFLESEAGSPLLMPLDGGCVMVDLESRNAHILVDPQACENPMQTVVNGCFFACAVSLPLISGVLLHGAGIVRKGRAFLFLGPSGAGKSTVARLSRADSTILSDDGVVLRAEDQVYRLHASPFTQTENDLMAPEPTGTYEIAAVLFLNKDKEARLQPINRAQAVIRLFNSHIHFHSFLPQDRLRQSFEICIGLCRSVPVYELHFARNRDFLDCLDEIPFTGKNSLQWPDDGPEETNIRASTGS